MKRPPCPAAGRIKGGLVAGGFVYVRRGGRLCPPHLRHHIRAGEDRVVLPYERLSLPFAIHPTPAVFVTPARRAEVVPPYGVICRRCIFSADYLTTFRAKKPCNSQKLVYNRVVEAGAALMQQNMGL